MTRSYLTIAVLILLVWNAPTAASQTDEISRAEYEVYSACLREGLDDDHLRSSRFVVVGEIVSGRELAQPDLLDRFDGQCKGLPDALAEAFLRRSQIEGNLDGPQFMGLKVEVIWRNELDAMFADPMNDGWDKFHKAYPGAIGIETFSRVAFDSTGNWAMVYEGFSCGSLCGQGNYVVLQRTEGQWHIICRALAWVS